MKLYGAKTVDSKASPVKYYEPQFIRRIHKERKDLFYAGKYYPQHCGSMTKIVPERTIAETFARKRNAFKLTKSLGEISSMHFRKPRRLSLKSPRLNRTIKTEHHILSVSHSAGSKPTLSNPKAPPSTPENRTDKDRDIHHYILS